MGSRNKKNDPQSNETQAAGAAGESGRFAYEGLERVIHEKARLSIMASLAANAGGLTFNASSLIAKALHPDATPSEEVRLEAFKAFSAWKGDRDAARRR